MTDSRGDQSQRPFGNAASARFSEGQDWATDLEYILLCSFGPKCDREMPARNLRLALVQSGLPHWAARQVTATSPLLERAGRKRYRLRPPARGLAD